MKVEPNQRPRLVRGARLRFDPHGACHVLLSPERGLRLNVAASEVVLRCTGSLTVREIAEELAERFDAASPHPAPHLARISEDVVELLAALRARGLIVLEPPS